MQICKMLDIIDSLISMSLRLNTSTPTFRTIRQTTGQKLNSKPSFKIKKRRKLQQLFLFEVFIAVDFHSLT